MTILFKCEVCGALVEEDDVGCWENNACLDCEEKRVLSDAARYRPLYEAEKRAGITVSLDELEQAIRDAGRGHLIRKD